MPDGSCGYSGPHTFGPTVMTDTVFPRVLLCGLLSTTGQSDSVLQLESHCHLLQLLALRLG